MALESNIAWQYQIDIPREAISGILPQNWPEISMLDLNILSGTSFLGTLEQPKKQFSYDEHLICRLWRDKRPEIS